MLKKRKMLNSNGETLEDNEKGQQQQQLGSSDEKLSNTNQQTEQSEEWETMAQAWVSAFPDAVVSASEVETWIGNNFDSLVADLRHMPRSELVDRLLSIQHYLRPTPLPDQNKLECKETNESETKGRLELAQIVETDQQPQQHPARFQRSDQWLPVYSWLESLDHGELVKSKDITEWLDANPEVKQELSSRHSRYHLTHYVKKCHLKLLKRKEKKGLIRLSRATAAEVHKEFGEKHPVTLSADPLSNIPKDSDLYRAKQKEAKRRYEILVELEKRLAPHFSKPRVANR